MTTTPPNEARRIGSLRANVVLFLCLNCRQAEHINVRYLLLFSEENYLSFMSAKHDPLLYEDAGEMVEYLA